MSQATTTRSFDHYFVPEPSKYPIFGAVALLLFGAGAAMWLNKVEAGPWMFFSGLAILIYMLFGWFGQVVRESESGLYGQRVDASFRWSMGWFIFSEVMFFAAFFGALFYARVLSVPWLASGDNEALLWQGFSSAWPSSGPYTPSRADPFTPMGAWGIPAINTLLLLEDLGFCPKGDGGRFVGDGHIAPGGTLPVNTNGGGLSYNHPGMYGMFLVVEAVRQLRGECGPRQVPGAEIAVSHGSGMVLSCMSTAVLGTEATL